MNPKQSGSKKRRKIYKRRGGEMLLPISFFFLSPPPPQKKPAAHIGQWFSKIDFRTRGRGGEKTCGDFRKLWPKLVSSDALLRFVKLLTYAVRKEVCSSRRRYLAQQSLLHGKYCLLCNVVTPSCHLMGTLCTCFQLALSEWASLTVNDTVSLYFGG